MLNQQSGSLACLHSKPWVLSGLKLSFGLEIDFAINTLVQEGIHSGLKYVMAMLFRLILNKSLSPENAFSAFAAHNS
jgi:hypothetical protein